ncbi:biotin--[acetyl-CoA-carboxylase] ligase [Algoriphagus mannitolivorans]|uniref:biotin--[acetyl-CoA-carboxylase] ligase n=1 Tax=Algoriphagus mannitolivorans TaxID=226504 RepID=UPI000427DE29|nr:biotin--[acetyl-CoA-carboxylase] ligase [Algoriphagus mannitolivorans]
MYKILANTIFLGKDVLFLPECHSTNDKALELVRSGKASEGSIVITDHQYRGKGQRGNVWLTQAGQNLTFSLILQPRFLDISEQFYLNMMVSNSIVKVFQDYIPDLKVKWPNDLVVENKGKIGGILIENTVGGKGWEFAVVGIGLNINQLEFSHPSAVSLAQIAQNKFDLQELFRLMVVALEQAYIQLKKGKLAEIRAEYLRNLYLREEWAEFAKGDKIFEGKIVGISKDGKLQIEHKSGEQEEFGLKEVVFPSF